MPSPGPDPGPDPGPYTGPDPGWRREWGLLLAAVQTLTRLPVAAPHGPDVLRRASRYLPLVGAGIGLVAAAAYALAAAGLPQGVAALAATAATLLLTGALHEDGLADTCDGLFGGHDRASALRIMRDSRLGSFGVLGLVVVVGTKLACLAALPNAAAALVAAHACSRFWPTALAAALPYARPDGMAGSMARPGRTELLAAAAFGLAPLLLLGPRAAPALLLAGLSAAALAWCAHHRLGGYTGDVLGAAQQLTEAAVLLAALWRPA